MADTRQIKCTTCETPGEADFSGATPVVQEGWEALLTNLGWEYECPTCWMAFLAHVAAQRLEHVA